MKDRLRLSHSTTIEVSFGKFAYPYENCEVYIKSNDVDHCKYSYIIYILNVKRFVTMVGVISHSAFLIYIIITS